MRAMAARCSPFHAERCGAAVVATRQALDLAPRRRRDAAKTPRRRSARDAWRDAAFGDARARRRRVYAGGARDARRTPPRGPRRSRGDALSEANVDIFHGHVPDVTESRTRLDNVSCLVYPVAAEHPRRGRRLEPPLMYPNRRRDSSPRNVHVAAAASPRPVSAEYPRRGRGVAAASLRLKTSGLFKIVHDWSLQERILARGPILRDSEPDDKPAQVKLNSASPPRLPSGSSNQRLHPTPPATALSRDRAHSL